MGKSSSEPAKATHEKDGQPRSNFSPQKLRELETEANASQVATILELAARFAEVEPSLPDSLELIKAVGVHLNPHYVSREQGRTWKEKQALRKAQRQRAVHLTQGMQVVLRTISLMRRLEATSPDDAPWSDIVGDIEELHSAFRHGASKEAHDRWRMVDLLEGFSNAALEVRYARALARRAASQLTEDDRALLRSGKPTLEQAALERLGVTHAEALSAAAAKALLNGRVERQELGPEREYAATVAWSARKKGLGAYADRLERAEELVTDTLRVWQPLGVSQKTLKALVEKYSAEGCAKSKWSFMALLLRKAGFGSIEPEALRQDCSARAKARQARMQPSKR